MRRLIIISVFLSGCHYGPVPTASELSGSHVDSLAATPVYQAYQDFVDTAYDRLRNIREVAEHPAEYTNVRWVKRRAYDSMVRVIERRKAYFARNGIRFLDSVRPFRPKSPEDTGSIDITPVISQ